MSLTEATEKTTETQTEQKLLFTPGPLTTTPTVKAAMQIDYGSRDVAFIQTVKEVRDELLKLGNVSQADGYEAVIMQGSGTFGIESVLSSVVPDLGNLLIIINGAYGERMAKMAYVNKLIYTELKFPENTTPDLDVIAEKLATDKSITHVAVVHCETTTGIFNPVQAIGQLVSKYDKSFIVDAMSSFGGVPFDIKANQVDFLVSSSNKCIEGVPGFSFIIADREELKKAKGQARSLTLDLYAQWEGLENNGQFRFTPPTHSIVAFRQALRELEAEGGVESRSARYQENYNTLIEGMRNLGFEEYLEKEKQGYIITSFLYPESAKFNFNEFYARLNEQGYVIYPGKLSQADCFRIGNIGQIFKKDVEGLITAIAKAKAEMGF